MLQLEKKVKSILKKKRISVDELTNKIGMSKQNLYNLFKTDDIKVSHIKKMSIFLGVPLDYFLTEDGELVNLPPPDDVQANKEQTKDLAYPDADVGKEVERYRQELEAERKRVDQLLLIVAEQAKH